MKNLKRVWWLTLELGRRSLCRLFGHRWVLARMDPVLWRPFNVCHRCGHIWSGPGEPL
jgi:hypothetical protein